MKHSDQQADGQFRPACVQHKSHPPYERQLCSSERPNHVDVLFDLTVCQAFGLRKCQKTNTERAKSSDLIWKVFLLSID